MFNFAIGHAAIGDDNRKVRRTKKRGARSRRIIITKVVGDREYSYHATKGWRSNKV